MELAGKYGIQLKGYNKYVFNKPNIRLFTHAFNLFSIENKIYLGQSWDGLFSYGIKSSDDRKAYLRFVDKLSESLTGFVADPVELYHTFGIRKIDEMDVLEMISSENFEVELSFIINQ